MKVGITCPALSSKKKKPWNCFSGYADSHLLVKSLKADLETLKMKLQTVEHSLASDIYILKKELAILKNAREADMATVMSKEKARNPGKPIPTKIHQ